VKLTVCSPMSPQTFATRRFMKLEFSICGFSYVFLHSLTPPNIQNMTRLVKFVDPIIVTRVSDSSQSLSIDARISHRDKFILQTLPFLAILGAVSPHFEATAVTFGVSVRT